MKANVNASMISSADNMIEIYIEFATYINSYTRLPFQLLYKLETKIKLISQKNKHIQINLSWVNQFIILNIIFLRLT